MTWVFTFDILKWKYQWRQGKDYFSVKHAYGATHVALMATCVTHHCFRYQYLLWFGYQKLKRRADDDTMS